MRRVGHEGILYHKQVEFFEGFSKPILVRVAYQRVGRDDPKCLDLTAVDRIDDLRIGVTPCSGDERLGYADNVGKLFSVTFTGVIAVARYRGGKSKLTRSHRIALSGDGHRCRSLFAEIAGDECKVADG